MRVGLRCHGRHKFQRCELSPDILLQFAVLPLPGFNQRDGGFEMFPGLDYGLKGLFEPLLLANHDPESGCVQ